MLLQLGLWERVLTAGTSKRMTDHNHELFLRVIRGVVPPGKVMPSHPRSRLQNHKHETVDWAFNRKESNRTVPWFSSHSYDARSSRLFFPFWSSGPRSYSLDIEDRGGKRKKTGILEPLMDWELRSHDKDSSALTSIPRKLSPETFGPHSRSQVQRCW